MLPPVVESFGAAKDLDTDSKMRHGATEIMDQALQQAAEDQLLETVSSESDDDSDVSTAKPTTTQRRQLQNAKFSAL